jgi:hypothetical protein
MPYPLKPDKLKKEKCIIRMLKTFPDKLQTANQAGIILRNEIENNVRNGNTDNDDAV